jgi:hypothetical protein
MPPKWEGRCCSVEEGAAVRFEQMCQGLSIPCMLTDVLCAALRSLQIAGVISPDVKAALECVKALSAIRMVDLDPGRVDSILKIALSNAMNVGGSLHSMTVRANYPLPLSQSLPRVKWTDVMRACVVLDMLALCLAALCEPGGGSGDPSHGRRQPHASKVLVLRRQLIECDAVH